MRAYAYYSDGSQTELSVINRDGVLVTERIPAKAGVTLLGVKVDMNESAATATGNPSPANVWAALSEAQREELRLAETDEIGDPKAWNELFTKGLVKFESNDEDEDGAKVGITDLGASVLAAAPTFLDDIESSIQTAVANGTVVDLTDEIFEEAVARPPVITAAQFVSEGYAAKVAAGECVVTITDSPYDTISAMELAPEHGEGYYRFYWAESAGTGISSGGGLKVRWQPATAPSPVPGGFPLPPFEIRANQWDVVASKVISGEWDVYYKGAEVVFGRVGNDGVCLLYDAVWDNGGYRIQPDELLQVEINSDYELLKAVTPDEERLQIIRDAFDLSKPIAPPVTALNQLQAENATLRADVKRLATERDALAARLAAVEKLAGNYSGATMPNIDDLGDVFQAECAYEELSQALADIYEQSREALRPAAGDVGDGAVYSGEADVRQIYNFNNGASQAVVAFPEHLKMREGETITVTITRKMRPAAESAEGEG